MTFNEYLINQRAYTHILPLAEELLFQNNKNYLFDLSFLGALKITGDRSREFLQGQLSCDIREITSHNMRQGALCNLKGRILALVDVIDWDGLHLILPKDLLTETQNVLSKVALLSRVTLEEASYHILGFYGSHPQDISDTLGSLSEDHSFTENNKGLCGYSLGHNLYVLIMPNNQASSLLKAFYAKQQLRGSLAWHYLQLKNKQVQIYPETRGLFLPHRLDLHLTHYLSFDKGCYKGQEIIARTHYRAKLKHSLALYRIQTTERLSSGKRLLDLSGNTELGELIDFNPLDNNQFLIAASMLLNHPNEVRIEGHNHFVQLYHL
jgi:folate-binding protein YgfZ